MLCMQPAKTRYIFNNYSEELLPENRVFVTDTHVFELYPNMFKGNKTIVIQPGEEHKTPETIQYIVKELLQFEAHRKTTLIGIGGGLVTDITGYVASIYMRGIPFGFIPTTLLGMVDAAIGGKNGVNFGLQKNLLGTINQPQFILFDTQFLNTLPEQEWSNGFAEVIKYACLFDKELFNELGANNLDHYQQNKTALTNLIQVCVNWKTRIVEEDERETGNRKLLNFGHTAGHAIETLYHLPHGYAVAIGMMIACAIAEQQPGADATIKKELKKILQQYRLPDSCNFDVKQVMNVLTMDKKRNDTGIEYILLKNIGDAHITQLPFNTIEQALTSIHASDH